MLNELKIQNRRSILLRLLDSGSATKPALGQQTGLSNTTVSDAINGMLQQGFVVAKGMEESIGGRRSAIYEINGDFGQFLGVELWAQGARAVCCDARGRQLDGCELVRETEEPAIQLLYRAVEAVQALPSSTNPLAIGVGLAGEIDFPEQTVQESRALGWQNVPLKELVERRFYLPAYIDSAINGQIALRRYWEGPDCPLHFMVLSEAFPSKAALCLDGSTCRGWGNRCGAQLDFDQALHSAVPLAETLGMRTLWVGCRKANYEKEVEKLRERAERTEIISYTVGPLELAWGMALEAETRWFGSIYFGSKNPC